MLSWLSCQNEAILFFFFSIPDDPVSPSSESADDHVFSDFVNLMQDIPPNEDQLHEDRETAHEENQVTFTEELSDLIEEIEVENARVDTEEPKNQNAEHELLYENERITVRESLLITMAVIM